MPFGLPDLSKIPVMQGLGGSLDARINAKAIKEVPGFSADTHYLLSLSPDGKFWLDPSGRGIPVTLTTKMSSDVGRPGSVLISPVVTDMGTKLAVRKDQIEPILSLADKGKDAGGVQEAAYNTMLNSASAEAANNPKAPVDITQPGKYTDINTPEFLNQLKSYLSSIPTTYGAPAPMVAQQAATTQAALPTEWKTSQVQSQGIGPEQGQTREQQLAFIQGLQNKLNAPAQGPSAAEALLRSGLETNLRNQMAQTASTRGGINQALAQRALATNATTAAQKLSQDLAVLRAQEAAQARAEQANLENVIAQSLQGVRGSDITAGTTTGGMNLQAQTSNAERADAAKAALAQLLAQTNLANTQEANVMARSNAAAANAAAQANQAAGLQSQGLQQAAWSDAMGKLLGQSALEAGYGIQGAQAAQQAFQNQQANVLSRDLAAQQVASNQATNAAQIDAAKQASDEAFQRNLIMGLIGGGASLAAGALSRPSSK